MTAVDAATRKRFGQHFLEPAWVDKVMRAIDPQPDETFIEIGPGRGALTRPLAARAGASSPSKSTATWRRRSRADGRRRT